MISQFMTILEQNFSQINSNIAEFSKLYGRNVNSVTLVAVGKKHPVDKIIALSTFGQQDFGENFVQEAVEKILYCKQQASPTSAPLRWHFVGHIQSRKCRELAQHFDWVHSVESIKVARKLSQFRDRGPLNILIQVNIDQEPTKSGIDPSQLSDLIQDIATLPNLRLRGLMIIPRAEPNFTAQREVFSRCRLLLENLRAAGYELDQLSMGMTNDMEAAIAEGATMVRIGTALFGQRPAA